MVDFEGLARRSFDEPLDVDDQTSLRVWEDALEAAGDPRGSLITMEFAIRDRPERRRELSRAMNAHLIENAAPIVAEIAPLLHDKRALELEWRAGRLYGASLDTRYIARKAKIGPHELVHKLLAAPVAATLRRLHVRVRRSGHIDVMLRALGARPREIEELAVMTEVRPRRLGTREAVMQYRPDIAPAYPRLRSLVVGDTVVALPATAAQLARATDPSDPADRRVIGCCLTGETELRHAALARLATLGPRAFTFVDTLLVLLGPGVVPEQDAIVRCLLALGGAARAALPQLAVITGRSAHYDLATRSAAGHAIAALRG